MSRVVDRRFIFGDDEKRFFLHWMRRLERFCGLEVVTYCLMSNHFHILVRVPARADIAPLDVASLLDALPLLYGRDQVSAIAKDIERAQAVGDGRWLDDILARFEARRGDLSLFLKDLKQRFTQWYNGRVGRRGTLWEDRFKSVLVEGSEAALLTVGAYIDLNPVRAGLCEDPKDYRWCGYAEAVAGERRARAGLCRILRQTPCGEVREAKGQATWKQMAPRYRLLLFGKGEAPGEGREARREVGPGRVHHAEGHDPGVDDAGLIEDELELARRDVALGQIDAPAAKAALTAALATEKDEYVLVFINMGLKGKK